MEDPLDVDLNLLPVLQLLIETRSVTLTAGRLGVSQSSVSRALTRLRGAFDDPLLIKTNAGMSVTKRAVSLRDELGHWLGTTRSLLRGTVDGDPGSFKGTFRVASTDYGVLTILAPAMQTILELAPDVRVDVVPLLPDNLNDLARGAIDVIVTGYDPEPGRACERLLYTETYDCVFRRDHPLSARERELGASCLSLEDLIEWPHVVAKVNDEDGDPVCSGLAKIGLSRRIACRVPYFSAAPHILSSCDAIMVLPKRAADRFTGAFGLSSMPAPIELEPFNYWMLWHERTRRDPMVRWLIERMSSASARLASDG